MAVSRRETRGPHSNGTVRFQRPLFATGCCPSVNLNRFIVRPLSVMGLYPFPEDFAGLRSERSRTGRTIIISRFLDLLNSINTSPGDPTGSAAVIDLSALKELWKRGCGRTSAGRPQSRYQIPKAVLSNGNRFGTGPIDLFAWENVPAKSCDSFSRERGD